MRLVNAFFMGLVFTFSIIFVIFVGLKINYFDFYKINEYFNPIFADNVNFKLCLALSFVLGYIMLYASWRKFFRVIYLLCLLGSLSVWVPSIGLWLGEKFFMNKMYTLPNGEIVTEIYSGRSKIYLKRQNGEIFNIDQK